MGHMAAYDKKKKCPVCGKEFWAARRSAKYDKESCRKAAQRDRQGIEHAAKIANKQIATIRGYFHDPDAKLDMKARRTLREFRELIDSWLLE